MVEMKRHMRLASSSRGGNPYLKVEECIQETIAVAESIAQCCSQQSLDDASAKKLSSSLERLLVLISPTELNNATKIGDTQQQRDGGASYDSSLSGIAANAILSHRVPYQNNEKMYLAFLLADTLATVLGADATDASDASLQSIQSQVSITLTQLSATEPPPPPITSYDQEQFSPYGHPSHEMNHVLADAPTSWCFVLVNSRALEALIQRITVTPKSSIYDVDTVEKCVWAIGNMAGDSEMAREALVKMGAVSRLFGCISFGMSTLSASSQQQYDVLQSSLMNLLRNSVWALVNFAREGMLTVNDLSIGGLSNKQLASMLLLPTTFSQESSSSTDKNAATSHDVAKETCWLLALLADKDTKVTIEYICQTNSSPVLSAIVTLLSLSADAAIQLCKSISLVTAETKQQLSEKCMTVIPLCRLLRNIARERNGAGLVLLASTPTTLYHPPEKCLANLISLITLGAGRDASMIACIAAETAGAFLYHADSSLAHSSTAACKVLLPALCLALISPHATFDFKREAVWALWNASMNEDDGVIGGSDEDFRTYQQQLLVEMANTSPPEFLRCLTSLLSTDDMDTVYPAMRLIDILLSRLEQLPSSKKLHVMFEEVGLVDALWLICDNDSDESDVAEMAANILDEYYEGEDNLDDEELLAPSSAGGSFQFHVPSLAPVSGFDFSSNPTTSVVEQQQQQPGSLRRGRGRGQQIPAWMQQS